MQPPPGYPGYQQPSGAMPAAGPTLSELKNRSKYGRAIIDRHGQEFLTPSDKAEHRRMVVLYKTGVAGMLLSFPISFYYGNLIGTDKANAVRYLRNNTTIAMGVTMFFIYTLWKRGKTEEHLALNYLNHFTTYELENFELNRFNNI